MIRIYCLLALLLVTACSHGVKPSLQSNLYEGIDQGDTLDSYRACLFLAEIPLQTDENLQTLRQKAALNDKNPLCYLYIIARRTIHTSDNNKFIDAMPSGETQMALWETHSKAGYPVSFVSPYIELLSNISIGNSTALAKLISAHPCADASYGESLTSLIAKHYKSQPQKVLQLLKVGGSSQKDIDYMIAVSGEE